VYRSAVTTRDRWPTSVELEFFVETKSHDAAVQRANRALAKIAENYTWRVGEVQPHEERWDSA
jgi:hypothetical protein